MGNNSGVDNERQQNPELFVINGDGSGADSTRGGDENNVVQKPIAIRGLTPGFAHVCQMLREDKYRPVLIGREGTLRFNNLAKQIELDGVGLNEARTVSTIRENIELKFRCEKILDGQPSRTVVSFSEEKISKALLHVAAESEFHPVKDYFDTLTWDGQPRLDATLGIVFGVKLDSLPARFLRTWMIQGVARVFEPGCKAELVLVLYCAQGVGKSTFFRKLVPNEDWFTDDKIETSDRDSLMIMNMFYIVEWAELSAIRKADAEAVKSFLSRQVDTYRAPYERTPEKHKRQVIFCATTNKKDFLRDGTGNRRFLPIEVDFRAAKFEWLEQNRDQLWAEAVHRFKQGERYWFTFDELQEIGGYVAGFEQEVDPAADEIERVAWSFHEDHNEPFSVDELIERWIPEDEYKVYEAPDGSRTTSKRRRSPDEKKKLAERAQRVLQARGYERTGQNPKWNPHQRAPTRGYHLTARGIHMHEEREASEKRVREANKEPPYRDRF